MIINTLNSNSNFMKTRKFFASAVICLALVTSFVSCSDNDDPDPVLEEELITDVVFRFVNDADPLNVVTFTRVAPDGQDGDFTDLTQGNFVSGATYSLEIRLLNSSEDPAEDVLNDDIIPEADEHFFVFSVSGLNLTMTRDADDIDGPDGTKLGVRTTWVAGAASTGNIRIRLVHEPGTVDDSDNFGSATGGSDDINITIENLDIL